MKLNLIKYAIAFLAVFVAVNGFASEADFTCEKSCSNPSDLEVKEVEDYLIESDLEDSRLDKKVAAARHFYRNNPAELKNFLNNLHKEELERLRNSLDGAKLSVKHKYF